MMLYHEADWKGTRDGLDALHQVHKSVPETKVILFGVPKTPKGLPPWVQYYCRPRQEVLCDLYNSASIFVSPSWAEGWPLPPAEAMMCGAALVATDIGGHREYAIHGKTALLSPAKHPRELAENILRLIRTPSLRIELANSGYKHIQQFTWDRATDAFEVYLSSLCNDAELPVTREL